MSDLGSHESHARSAQGRWFVLLVALAAWAAPCTDAAVAAPSSPAVPLRVIVQRSAPGTAAADAVRRLGGRVDRQLAIVDGFVATLPAGRLGALRRAAGVRAVTPDSRLAPRSDDYDATADPGSMYSTTAIAGARDAWVAGFTGNGVDVALIDSGVAPVDGLDGAGKIVNGPDLSFESQASGLAHLDTYGHGTHMAGIIGGRDAGTDDATLATDSAHFLGVAPDARLVSVKVADAHGATDVSQVIAAIDWVVQHRNRDGLNIRVLNLSYGTNSSQSYLIDPLAAAVEVAWRRGIVVVAAAGNWGFKSPGPALADPARDPYVVAVGAADPNGTPVRTDDSVAAFSSNGSDRDRAATLVAPGRSIVSLRVPGSDIDLAYGDTGRVGERFFRGSGTSQATAVTSGAVALLLQQRPELTPDQVKLILTRSAFTLTASTREQQGAGELDIANALGTPRSTLFRQLWLPSFALGSLDAARGTLRLSRDGVALDGERDIFGARFVGSVWNSAALAGRSWTGGNWNGRSWTGDEWLDGIWEGRSWTSLDWSGRSWTSDAWTANIWTGLGWSGDGWAASDWAGADWSGEVWATTGWQ